MSDLPLHVQVLLALKKQAQHRQRVLEGRTGSGLPDQEYQRHVGRIAECKVFVESLDTMLKRGLDELEDGDENDDREEQRARRPANRRGAGLRQ